MQAKLQSAEAVSPSSASVSRSEDSITLPSETKSEAGWIIFDHNQEESVYADYNFEDTLF